jgi:hypothetical protein
MNVRVLRVIAGTAIVVGLSLAVAGVLGEREPPFPTLPTSLSVAFYGLLAIPLLRRGSYLRWRDRWWRIRGRMPRLSARLTCQFLIITILLFPLGMGYGSALLVRGVLLRVNPPEATTSRRAGPPDLIRECLDRIPPGGRVLLAGSRSRDLRGYLLAYYLHPRALYMMEDDQMEMFFGHRMQELESEDPGMIPFPPWQTPSDEAYREFIREKDIRWVILNRTGNADDAVLLPAEEAFP